MARGISNTTRKRLKRAKPKPLNLPKKRKKRGSAYEETALRIAFFRWFKYVFRRMAVALTVIIFVISLGTGGWLWHSGLLVDFVAEQSEKWVALTGNIGTDPLKLRVGDVFVEGQRYTNAEDLLAAMNINRGEPILGVDLHAMKSRLEALDWVKQASIDRELPNAIHVKIIERTPVALWQKEGKLYVISSEGHVIKEKNVSQFAKFIIMVGEDAPAHTNELIKILNTEPKLKKHVSSAIRVGERRWNVRMDNRIEIKLPEEKIEQAWSRLSELQKKHKILDSDIIAIDLRLEDKVSVQHISDPEAEKEEQS